MKSRSIYRVRETEHAVTTAALMALVWWMSPYIPITIPNGTFQSVAMLSTPVLLIFIATYHSIKLPYYMGVFGCFVLAMAAPLGVNPTHIVVLTYIVSVLLAGAVVISPDKFTLFKNHGKTVEKKSRKVEMLLALPFGAGIVVGVPTDIYRNNMVQNGSKK